MTISKKRSQEIYWSLLDLQVQIGQGRAGEASELIELERFLTLARSLAPTLFNQRTGAMRKGVSDPFNARFPRFEFSLKGEIYIKI